MNVGQAEGLVPVKKPGRVINSLNFMAPNFFRWPNRFRLNRISA